MGLSDREEKRRKSVVGAMIDAMDAKPEQPEKDTSSETIEIEVKKSQEKESFVIKPKQKEETRSKRVNFLIQPSVYNKAQKKCKKLEISLNECINQFLENWLNDN